MEIIENPEVNLWQEIADKCDYATFFHTPAWAKILESTYPDYQIATKGFILGDGVRVILPLMELKKFRKMARAYFSMLSNIYGGIVADGEVDDKRISKIYEHLLNGSSPKSINVAGNPFKCYDLPEEFKSRQYFTQIINLEYGYKAIYDRYRHNIRKRSILLHSESVWNAP